MQEEPFFSDIFPEGEPHRFGSVAQCSDGVESAKDVSVIPADTAERMVLAANTKTVRANIGTSLANWTVRSCSRALEWN